MDHRLDVRQCFVQKMKCIWQVDCSVNNMHIVRELQCEQHEKILEDRTQELACRTVSRLHSFLTHVEKAALLRD